MSGGTSREPVHEFPVHRPGRDQDAAGPVQVPQGARRDVRGPHPATDHPPELALGHQPQVRLGPFVTHDSSLHPLEPACTR